MSNKLIIYQVLPRLFGNTNQNCVPGATLEINGCGKLNFFTPQIINKIKDLGCTHIWFTGVLEHATKSNFQHVGIEKNCASIVKGEAGSPYAITDYYDIAPSLATDIPRRVAEFEDLIERCHNCGLKVIIDFVPNHVSRAYKSDSMPASVENLGERDKIDYPFHPMNNFYYIPDVEFVSPVKSSLTEQFYEYPAKVTGNDCFSNSPNEHDWFETVKLNYGVDYQNNNKEHFDPVPDTWYKMEEIILFWCRKGVDGFRCDMAQMVPVAFWGWLIERVKSEFANVLFIAELYQKSLYFSYLQNGKFDYLYDKGLYDTLREITEGKRTANEISYCWQSIDNIQDRVVNFIENHDEQRAASPFFAGDGYRAIPAVAVSLMLNRAPFMLYFGQELGESGMESEGYSQQDGRTTIYDYWSVKSVREWLSGQSDPPLRELYKTLLNIALTQKAINIGVTFDLQYANANNQSYYPEKVFSFMRKSQYSLILITANFSDYPVDISLEIPVEAYEFLNLDNNREYSATDLITGLNCSEMLVSGKKYDVTLEKNGFRIIKFSL